MADDPVTNFLDKVRPRAASSEPPPSPTAAPAKPRDAQGREAYEAFDAQDRAAAHGFEILCNSDEDWTSHFVWYHQLLNVTFGRRRWRRLLLTASGLVIEIRGRNLEPLAEAIRTKRCAAIHEYSPDEFVLPQPEDPTATFIESILVDVIGGQDPPVKPNDNKQTR